MLINTLILPVGSGKVLKLMHITKNSKIYGNNHIIIGVAIVIIICVTITIVTTNIIITVICTIMFGQILKNT